VEVFDLMTLVNGVEATNTVSTLPPAVASIRIGRTDWMLFYTLDGTEPDASSVFYLDQLNLTESATFGPWRSALISANRWWACRSG